MMNNTLKNLCKVAPGTIIEGKWHHKRYTVIKELGYGANGIVYLAQHNNRHYALKMSDNGISITSEVNVLKSFAKVQGSTLGPSLIDVDDWVRRGGNVSFYVMEYIQGPDLLSFVQQKGESWIDVLILQLLKDLEQLHMNGWVFGDLKPENLIVNGPPPRIRCIDVGGTTIQGRAIKEFTEFYDRGYWGLGTRKAEPTYDLFAVAMILINMAYPKRFNKTTGGFEQLKSMVKQKKQLHKYEEVIFQALQGKYQTAKEMRVHFLRIMNNHGNSDVNVRQVKQRTNTPQPKSQKVNPIVTRQVYVKKKKKSSMLETILIVMIISFLYFIYIYGQLV
ncbi:protein kinase family protein [Bacillus sp. 31A1R]|uniref:Protein kinase family protein n=1 Tax=Robertmurraya mangrovi TaxID=3098077 RepID=A0ABU5J4G6_9BACI|nr:protein kinase family protein [Bacillus sp. 31A1R]MDZ5474315.1 protein kinase family protein [Bacillus sp. 31A1R]